MCNAFSLDNLFNCNIIDIIPTLELIKIECYNINYLGFFVVFNICRYIKSFLLIRYSNRC